jgi:hypothetical protein
MCVTASVLWSWDRLSWWGLQWPQVTHALGSGGGGGLTSSHVLGSTCHVLSVHLVSSRKMHLLRRLKRANGHQLLELGCSE